MILIGLIVARQWKLLGAYAAAALLAVLPLSITGNGIAAPQWHFDLSDRLRHAAVAVPRRPALDRDARRGAHRVRSVAARRAGGAGGGRCCWRSCRSTSSSAPSCRPAPCSALRSGGSSARWSCWSSAPRPSKCRSTARFAALARRGFVVSTLTVVRPAGTGPLVLSAEPADPETVAVVEMYGPHQRSGGALRQFWRMAAVARQRDRPIAGLDAPRRRASRADGHRDRRPGRRQYLDDRRRPARPRVDVVRAQAAVAGSR